MVAIPLKWMLENSIGTSYKELKLGGANLSVELRTKLGQNLAVALLSGFRGFVADMVWLKAHGAWEKGIWAKMKDDIELAVVLQPHSILFWDVGSWHMAWNASYGESTNPNYPNRIYRLKAQRDWIFAGKKFLEEGIRNNPDHYDLYFRLAWMYYQKLEDPAGAVPLLKKASTFPGVPSYVPRMVGHMYEKAAAKAAKEGNSDEERQFIEQAYEWWKTLWNEDHSKNPYQLWERIAKWGSRAEEKLHIPHTQRIFPSE